MPQNVTMSDVARRAGVTRATVSFVINQRSRDLRISPRTQRKVLAAIESLNYRVNAAAQSTSRGRSFGIGIMAPGGSRLSTAWSEQVEGINRAADERGYHVVYVGVDESSDSVDTPKMIQQNLVDGVIFLISCAPVETIDRAIRRYNIPTVWIQRRRKHDAIWLDEAAFAEEGVAHLIAQGHRRIVLMDSTDDTGSLWSQERSASFEQAMLQAELKPRIVTLNAARVVAELSDLLKEPDRPTAFLTGATVFGNYLVMLAHLRGLRVPQDVAVVSVGSAKESTSSIPQLTRWDNELQQLGYRAGNMLIDRIEKDIKQPALTLRGHLCPAGTTVPNTGENRV